MMSYVERFEYYDVLWGLFLKLCPIYFLRLQRKHKTSRSFCQQI